MDHCIEHIWLEKQVTCHRNLKGSHILRIMVTDSSISGCFHKTDMSRTVADFLVAVIFQQRYLS